MNAARLDRASARQQEIHLERSQLHTLHIYILYIVSFFFLFRLSLVCFFSFFFAESGTFYLIESSIKR